MTDDRTTADALRDHPDLARYARGERGHAVLTKLLAEQRASRADFRDIEREARARMAAAQENAERAAKMADNCDEAIEILERVLGGSLAA